MLGGRERERERWDVLKRRGVRERERGGGGAEGVKAGRSKCERVKGGRPEEGGGGEGVKAGRSKCERVKGGRPEELFLDAEGVFVPCYSTITHGYSGLVSMRASFEWSERIAVVLIDFGLVWKNSYPLWTTGLTQ